MEHRGHRGYTEDTGECGNVLSGKALHESLVVEVKAVEAIRTVHEAQLPTYLRLSGMRPGLLMNFNVRHLRDGILGKIP